MWWLAPARDECSCGVARVEHRLFSWHMVLHGPSTTGRSFGVVGVERWCGVVGWFSTLLGPEDSNMPLLWVVCWYLGFMPRV